MKTLNSIIEEKLLELDAIIDRDCRLTVDEKYENLKDFLRSSLTKIGGEEYERGYSDAVVDYQLNKTKEI